MRNCVIPECRISTAGKMMCPFHWLMVPAALQDKVAAAAKELEQPNPLHMQTPSSAYHAGKRNTLAYVQAREKALIAVFEKEVLP